MTIKLIPYLVTHPTAEPPSELFCATNPENAIVHMMGEAYMSEDDGNFKVFPLTASVIPRPPDWTGPPDSCHFRVEAGDFEVGIVLTPNAQGKLDVWGGYWSWCSDFDGANKVFGYKTLWVEAVIEACREALCNHTSPDSRSMT